MEVSIEIRNFNLDAPSTRRRWGFGNPSTEGGNEGKCWCEEVEGGGQRNEETLNLFLCQEVAS